MKQPLVLKELWQHCAIRQSDSARDFSSSQDLKSAGILHVFQTFQTAEQLEKICRSAKAQCWLIYPPLKALCKIEAEKSNANAMDENSIQPFFTCAEQTLHTQSPRQPIGIIFTPSGRVYASSPPVMTINKSGSRRFVLPETFAARTSCLI